MHPTDLGSGVIVFAGSDVRFNEVPGAMLTPALLAAVDGAWDAAVLANPVLFDGPVVLCDDVRQTATRLEISWSRATYRYRTLREIPGAPALSSVFVCVLQPAADGRLLVGHMSATTSSPGLVQFPGGNVEPTPLGEELTLQTLQRHAATELVEETGIQAAPEHLKLWAVARTTNLNVGLFFVAPSLPEEFIRKRHESVVLAERVKGREPEFAEISLVAQPVDLPLLNARVADYLDPLIARFRSTSPSC